ncbi:MAG: hypothetical protein K9H25_17120 [Rhodospirillum sp.]|nr:hypothetical protein [Rhodospirillum sp.]MCF8501773.1 hypothetical protein [Rhodospirillum sp.]
MTTLFLILLVLIGEAVPGRQFLDGIAEEGVVIGCVEQPGLPSALFQMALEVLVTDPLGFDPDLSR